ncbi:Fic family protein [Aureimonas flava]|uniref:Fic family protein n=1 Tax=Aureimonas flava TaxID=2320271 RepID=A0A3A1WNQ1_9HYPH|nr:Fic family protein [Aureimonas flava]RIX98710.1 Fic family protein [Aureimonas flava]
MASLNEKMATSLTRLKDLTAASSRRVFRSSEFSRTDRERLLSEGYLEEVIAGWVMVGRPTERRGDTTSWYASFWQFCCAYLDDRFGEDWVLAPETSIRHLTADNRIPTQVLVRAPRGNNGVQALPHGTSIMVYRAPLPVDVQIDGEGVRAYSAEEALAAAPPRAWADQHEAFVALLGSIRGVASLSRPLLRDGNVAAASRLSGALALLGRTTDADQIVSLMKRAGHDVRPDMDPFGTEISITLGRRPEAPVATRIRLMWSRMRKQVLEAFPDEPREILDVEGYLAAIDESHTSDAYHSLSIEGYRVSEELIERVRGGNWNPAENGRDEGLSDAMAAKGYLEAHELVKETIVEVFDGMNSVDAFETRHQDWFGALFRPAVTAGLMRPESLAGYRNVAIRLRGSGHIPPAGEIVPDAMEAFIECLRSEEDPRVRAILGHFVFTYVHPLPDGNGRCGRFLMNLMLASGGYPWTIIPVDRRTEYMEALEEASGQGDIGPFTRLVVECLSLEPPPPRRLREGEKLEERADPVEPAESDASNSVKRSPEARPRR